MKNLWYRIIRGYVKTGLYFYYKSIITIGQENIPKNKPVLFIANHRNGLIDPILIAITSNTIHHYFTRASAFKNPIADYLLRTINMVPIYRIRDGVDSIALNHDVFKNSYEVFKNNGTFIIFPEGNHDLPRKLRSLKKGFMRIAFGFLKENPEKELYIVPVGVNYEEALKPFTKVGVHYGPAIKASEFYDPENIEQSFKKLNVKASEELRKVSVHIDDLDNIETIESQLLSEGYDFTDPILINERIKSLDNITKNRATFNVEKNGFLMKFLYVIFFINSIFPILIWRNIKTKVADPVLVNTFRFGLGLGLYTLFYLVQTVILSYIFNWKIGLIYLVASLVITGIISKYYHYKK